MPNCSCVARGDAARSHAVRLWSRDSRMRPSQCSTPSRTTVWCWAGTHGWRGSRFPTTRASANQPPAPGVPFFGPATSGAQSLPGLAVFRYDAGLFYASAVRFTLAGLIDHVRAQVAPLRPTRGRTQGTGHPGGVWALHPFGQNRVFATIQDDLTAHQDRRTATGPAAPTDGPIAS